MGLEWFGRVGAWFCMPSISGLRRLPMWMKWLLRQSKGSGLVELVCACGPATLNLCFLIILLFFWLEEQLTSSFPSLPGASEG